MPSERTAAGIRALLRWLSLLGEGNVVVERWRADALRDRHEEIVRAALAELRESPAGGSVPSGQPG